jgi:hypothetical protein
MDSDKEERNLKEKEKLQKVLLQLLQSKDFADFTIKTRSKSIKAHKFILACMPSFNILRIIIVSKFENVSSSEHCF